MQLNGMGFVVVFNLKASPILIETDSKVCYDALVNSTSASPWRICPICSDIQSLFSYSPNVSIFWVSRLANVAAHTLAKWSL